MVTCSLQRSVSKRDQNAKNGKNDLLTTIEFLYKIKPSADVLQLTTHEGGRQMFNPIQKNNISNNVFTQMLDMIVTGVWRLDDKIPSENELKDQFNVSRNSVRYAIQRLSALGLLEARQGEGTFVKRLDMSFYLNTIIPTVFLGDNSPIVLMEYQRALQLECARLATLRRTDTQLAELFGYVEKMRKSCGDHELFLKNDISYHVLLAEMSFNELFMKSMQILKVLLFHSLKTVVNYHDCQISIDHHEQIAKAIENRDADLAFKIMNDHMQDIMKSLILIVDEGKI